MVEILSYRVFLGNVKSISRFLHSSRSISTTGKKRKLCLTVPPGY